ncbi:MAG: NAD(+)/NADH kinase [Pirellulales bacterium]|nr:NAD(+)/NADH kinase [Pirellulales bacterium]
MSSRPRVLVLAYTQRPQIAAEAARLRPSIERIADVVLYDETFAADLSTVEADFSIVMGGDGSILRAAHQMGNRQLPVLGVNLGKLGFLADLTPDEMLQVLPQVAAGDYHTVEHLMFDFTLLRGEKIASQLLGLNEATIQTGAPFSLLEVQLYVDAELVTTYSCDGLIVSTPVGSTAHNLSAGGPILRKDLEAFVISPISPPTLTNRPVVDSADRVYEMVVAEPHEGTSVVVDGRLVGRLKPHDRVRVQRAEQKFKLIEVAGHNYYRTLREKLGWGGRLRYADGR